MKTKYEHIRFVEDFEQLGFDKPVYICRNNRTDDILGFVAYYPPWQRYEFMGEKGTGFDTSCLTDIIDFMKQLKT